jgi:BASS family bile acid:Na+ symporter
MNFMVNVALPLSLAVIMLSLGLGLEVDDFTRVTKRRKPFLIGAVAQVFVLPAFAFAVLMVFSLPPEIAVGVMLLSFCPGGVTSNILSKLARGDVALSVSLTAVISLLSILTVPFLTAWSIAHFLGEQAPPVDITRLALALFLITTLPTLTGIALRHFARAFALMIEPALSRLAWVLFVVIILAVLAGNWDVFKENVTVMGEALVALNVGLLLLGLGLGRLARLSWVEMKTISVETGIQNGTLGITLAGLVSGVTEGFSAMALPSAVYSITMYLVTLPFIFWLRRR